MSSKPLPPEAQDVEFLTEEFGIPPFKAARLVAGRNEMAEDLAEAELQRQHEADPLADVPTPKPPSNDYIVEPGEDQLKPILNQHNLRGAG